MFAELKNLLEKRDLILTLSALSTDNLRVTVSPKAKKNAESADKLEPLVIEGTAEELDKDFAKVISEYSNSARTLDDTMAQIKADTEAAIKAAKAEAATKVDAAKSAAESKKASKASVQAGKAAAKTEPAKPEPKKEEPAAPTLFDAEPAAEPEQESEGPAAAILESATQENPVEGRTEPFVEIIHATDTPATALATETEKEAEVGA